MKQTTDVRLALVMNGGVSLAVWMGGITHELDLLRRASESVRDGIADDQDDPWAPTGADLPVFQAWKAICRAFAVHVTIDVVAGASAGGLNGTLLATSIANGGALPNLREKWSALASLEPGKLLRDAPDGSQASILDGDYFAAKAFELVSDITTAPDRAREMSLFVTATVAGPADQGLADSSGNRFSVPDHRRLYRFRRRTIWQYDPERQTVQQLRPGAHGGLDEFAAVDALSLAARASAGFPVAFEPKRETAELSRLRHPGVGAPTSADRGPWLIDGGVLDNAPFGPVLEEIAQQNVDSPWRRVVAYVVPSGSASSSVKESADAPPPWTSTLGAALRFPAEADLRGDLDQIGELMRRAARWVQTPDELFAGMIPLKSNDAEAVDEATDTLRRAGITLAGQYRQARIRAGVLDALTLWRSRDTERRLAVQTVSPMTPTGDELWIPPEPNTGEDLSLQGHDPWLWGTAVADRVLRLLLRHLRAVAENDDLPACADAIDRVGDLVQQCVAVRQAIEDRLLAVRPTNLHELSDEEASATALKEINAAVTACSAAKLLGELVGEAADAYRKALGLTIGRTDVISRALIVEITTRAFTDRETFERVVDFEFLRFGPDCATDRVQSGAWGSDFGDWKLWGTHFLHFGAFGSAAWRDWDWAWGRLDGAAHLVNLLAVRTELDEATIRSHRSTLLQAIEESEGFDRIAARETLQKLWDVRTSDGRLLKQFRDSEGHETIRHTADAALRLLRHNDPAIPKIVRRTGPWVSFALAEKPTKDETPVTGLAGRMLAKVVRGLARKARAWLYGKTS